jgi:hypothetical protein
MGVFFYQKMSQARYTSVEARAHSRDTAIEQSQILKQNIISINKKKQVELNYA